MDDVGLKDSAQNNRRNTSNTAVCDDNEGKREVAGMTKSVFFSIKPFPPKQRLTTTNQ